ncbi:putative endoplasmic reticulum oxidoreductin 1, ERO1-like superfamily [Helianthus annuus]|uniref:Endoplasmic reticulum oxidoreductin 1, ERO1-like superfamily n=1 Tax=Helianthus annuus TaxID=4232 RepID=A0A251TBT1_HELAN|nr:endoplasmic reticulum oxidoreductin-1 [Helianthus annuus]KAF5780654.1 putative endoplasmic reticulum oxidoreductin 1, ERO1-like superfamily [Helianthus annuus]KAJ0500415.1 putative endoplasmic reticulum oxidoreductin 1, ERO1-like superfamily [Helianthus annuus]KAJ0507892.1 putative endoplasmic reticulum oxidoreductin 1, ERO1-like superfamily [Helianthus annuus]KAJ0516267.1 putative endoplasmic reticulum oxidoreductin 1, ERO1-like superfamily [Helianthus annuus]KAJ0688238.1 putative endoplas
MQNVDRKSIKNSNVGDQNKNKRKRLRLIAAVIVGIVAAYLHQCWHSLSYSILLETYICSKDTCGNKGIVEECCCDYESINDINGAVLHPLLQELVKTPFFRYYKVKLWCDCLFWPDDGMCRMRDCSVCECPENEFPESFKKPSLHTLPNDDPVCQEGKPEATVDRTLDARSFRGWVEVDNPWTHDDETDNGEMTYVNLQLNAERYTGYTGPSARRIWDAIYTENCPKYAYGETCPEKKVLFKLISGLHSSISSHIAADYLLDETNNKWGPNLKLMRDRVLKHHDRVENLYFTFLFVLRAVTKAAAYLDQAEYDSGNHMEDLRAQLLIRQLVHDSKLQDACALPFYEAELWQGQGGPILRQQIQNQFRNISALMDCVGCEKCRLWGKLQVLGLGTSLQILFSVDDQGNPDPHLQLQRNEVIALLNLLNRLSESLIYVTKMRDQIAINPLAKIIGLVQRQWGSSIAHWWKKLSKSN